MTDRRRADALAWSIMWISLVILTISLLMANIKVPYAVESPGPVRDTLASIGEGEDAAKIITVDEKTYPTTGHLYFTTVSVQGSPDEHITLWEWLLGTLDSESDVVPEEQVFGTGYTEKQVKELNAAQMQGSQKNAVAAALRSMGKDVPQDNVVASIAEDYPAAKVLELKDEIRKVDGEPVTTVADVIAAISDRTPGEGVELTIERDGREQDVQVGTKDLGGGRAGIGVGIDALYDFPIEVEIDAGNVGGPSAGMMFALAIYDVLTPGALTSGTSIAGTGTIDDAGAVGPIGGIEQKMIGAQEGGAAYFLAPRANCSEVSGNVPSGLTVLEVATLDDAVGAVEAAAKGDVSAVPSCGTR
ncbi:PDZ domain-containing protein [Marihabitans asiaticum]|uniref:endopeptidase La n=1 Tax=Marihabitans asiaticum TaxID=415218 RepID=A0A560WI87_9MICO|nr:PDZ domain-containing protein [Marihabitans asiaticum]TWD17359.1 PDZ domain-containing protein [Marihabitans asiaticum]